MLLAEELLLLALDPEKGKPVNSSRAAVTVGMSGALIAELALDGRVELDGERFVPVWPAPGHPLLAEASSHLDRMRGDRKVKRAADQIRALDKALDGTWDRVVGGLVESRVLARDRRRVLLFPVTRYRVRQTRAREDVLRRVRAAASDGGSMDPRTATVLALSGPSRLLEVVAPERSGRDHARARIEAATRNTPVTPAVKKVLDEAAAAMVAITAATSAATSAATISSS
ncbi:GPP34 family phosphoprotein [Frankia sp. Hr75.2]|nr:GPP34 family phosphoprotein [Frankia sp. Hr75.2]